MPGFEWLLMRPLALGTLGALVAQGNPSSEPATSVPKRLHGPPTTTQCGSSYGYTHLNCPGSIPCPSLSALLARSCPSQTRPAVYPQAGFQLSFRSSNHLHLVNLSIIHLHSLLGIYTALFVNPQSVGASAFPSKKSSRVQLRLIPRALEQTPPPTGTHLHLSRLRFPRLVRLSSMHANACNMI